MSVANSLNNAEWISVDDVAWAETLQEVENGWLEVEENPNFDDHFIAKRFPVQQKEKIRLIDDFSICGVNSSFGLTEKFRVNSIDEIVAGLAVLIDANVFDLGTAGLCGCTFDLKSAYKQFGVDSQHAKKLRIAVKKPGGGVA